MNNWFLLAAIPVFGLLIIVHEFGHFITAKWAGIRVEEFALGFPPRIFGFKRGETTYSINLFPFGGYVRMPGENGEMTDEQGHFDPRSFAAKPASKRLIVLLAGVTMNVILALVRRGHRLAQPLCPRRRRPGGLSGGQCRSALGRPHSLGQRAISAVLHRLPQCGQRRHRHYAARHQDRPDYCSRAAQG